MDEKKERSREAVRSVWVRPADWFDQNREWGGGAWRREAGEGM